MLHLPETAHLYVLLNCAQFNQEKYLDPEIESYLIQTLLRYSEKFDDDNYSELIQAGDLDISDETCQDEYLKEIADYCLICTGLMSDQFVFEEMSYERLQEVGQNAFAMLSDHTDTQDNIYSKLSQNFSSLVDILQCSQTLITDHLSENKVDYIDNVNDEHVSVEVNQNFSFPNKKKLFFHSNILYH